jgi:hypothetical protein
MLMAFVVVFCLTKWGVDWWVAGVKAARLARNRLEMSDFEFRSVLDVGA